MDKVEFKGGTLLAPLPVIMVSCGGMEKSNIITIAWAGITNSVPPKTYISIRPERHSYSIIKESREFVLNVATSSLIAAADFCGFRSGRDIDKFKFLKLNKKSANKVACPLIEESPLNIECKVTDIIPLGSHDMFLADIVSVNADTSLIDKNGKLRMDKADLVAFSHGEYYTLGDKVGQFGYSIQKKNLAAVSETSARENGAGEKPPGSSEGVKYKNPAYFKRNEKKPQNPVKARDYFNKKKKSDGDEHKSASKEMSERSGEYRKSRPAGINKKSGGNAGKSGKPVKTDGSRPAPKRQTKKF